MNRSRKSWHQQFRRSAPEERTDVDGTTFHSKSEMARWRDLKLLQVNGDIRNLQRQVKFPLILPNYAPILTAKGRTACYTADFVYEVCDRQHSGEVWTEVIEDHKGHYDRESQFRIAVFEAIKGVKVKITKRGKS